MRYERDPGLGAHVTVIYVGPWLGPDYIATATGGYATVAGWVEPCGVYDATELLEPHIGEPWGELLPLVLADISVKCSSWEKSELLAYLNPVKDGRITFTLVEPQAPIAFPGEPLPAREDRADTVHRAGGQDYLDKLKEIRDATRAQLEEDDWLIVQVPDTFIPNQIREYQGYLREVLQHDRIAVMIGTSYILGLDEPYTDPERPQEKRTRVGGTWVLGHVSEDSARIQAASLHQEQLEHAKLGLKEAKTATVEWWEHGERLAEPPAEVAG